MRTLPPAVFDQIARAYRRMAAQGYRPAAPSDGLGNITVAEEDLDVDREAALYAQRWWNEEAELTFSIGCCDFRLREAMVPTIEAARLMCAGERELALELLKAALETLEEAGRDER